MTTAVPNAPDVPVGVAATSTDAYAGGSRFVDGGKVFAVARHDLSTGSLVPPDFQWPIDSEGANITATAMTFVNSSQTPSFIQMFLSGTAVVSGYLRPVSISVLGDDGEPMTLAWSQYEGSSEDAGDEIPVAMALARIPDTGVVSAVGILTDADDGSNRFRVYIRRITDGALRGQINFQQAIWEGLDDKPVGLALTDTEAWVACTHIDAAHGGGLVHSVRIYRFDYRGNQLQAPIKIEPPPGRQYILRAANSPYLPDSTDYYFLLACQDVNTIGTSADFLTLLLGFDSPSNTLVVLGSAVEDMDVIDNPRAITAGYYGPQEIPSIPTYIHTHVTGTSQSAPGGQSDIVTLQYKAPHASGFMELEWWHRLQNRPGIDIPNAIAFCENAAEPRVLVVGTTETAAASGIYRYITLVYTGRVQLQQGEPRLLSNVIGPCEQETNLDVGRRVHGFTLPTGGAVGVMTGSSRHPVNHDDFVTTRFVVP